MKTTGKIVLRAALFAALLTATGTTVAAFAPPSNRRCATDLRDAPSSLYSHSYSSSSSPSSISGRERRSNLSTYAPYSTNDGRVGVIGVVGSPDGSFGTGAGAGNIMIPPTTAEIPPPPPLPLPAASRDVVVHVERATPEPPPFVASSSSSSSSPPRRYGIGSWEGSSSSSSSPPSSKFTASGSAAIVVPNPSSLETAAIATSSPTSNIRRPPRRPIVAGNWKLNPSTRSDAMTLLRLLSANFVNHRDGDGRRDEDDDRARRDSPEAVIFPPLPYISDAMRVLEGSGMSVGVQNCGMHDKGAYTGEIAPSMVSSIGCSHVLLGHSERRVHFGETDRDINAALRNCLAAPGGLRVVLCVGETLEEYESGALERVVRDQLSGCLRGVDPDAIFRDGRVVIAYEPVWAIGTGLVASPSQAQAAHVVIRNALSSLLCRPEGETMEGGGIRILYGGSVTPDNVRGIMDMDVDGVLVGGASLNADSFTRIYDGAVDAYDGKKKASSSQKSAKN